MKSIHTSQTNSSGFIALMSVILLSMILFTLTVSLSSSSFSARTNALHNELKRHSVALAESCMYMALLKLTQTYSYSPQPNGDIVHTDTEICTIVNIFHETENTIHHTKKVTILTKGNYNGAFTIMKVSAKITNPYYITPGISPITVEIWKEATTTQI